MTDGVTYDIIWIQGTRMPWSDTRLGHRKKEKIYILYMFYISNILYICSIYLICILNILYRTYISEVNNM